MLLEITTYIGVAVGILGALLFVAGLAQSLFSLFQILTGRKRIEIQLSEERGEKLKGYLERAKQSDEEWIQERYQQEAIGLLEEAIKETDEINGFIKGTLLAALKEEPDEGEKIDRFMDLTKNGHLRGSA